MVRRQIQLFVFHRSVSADRVSLDGGAAGVVVDMETCGKKLRQFGMDTQINAHSPEDVRAVKGELSAVVICRINCFNADIRAEIEAVIAAGADEILLPMVETEEEARAVLNIVDGRCGVGVMVETEAAVRICGDLAQLPISRLYVGLNDLCISRRSDSIFDAIEDGVVEHVRQKTPGAPFGFGGLTIPGGGHPLPVYHLVNEIARLDCAFTFLRRSFFRDTENRRPQEEIPRIIEAVEEARRRPAAAVKADHAALIDALRDIRAAALCV